MWILATMFLWTAQHFSNLSWRIPGSCLSVPVVCFLTTAHRLELYELYLQCNFFFTLFFFVGLIFFSSKVREATLNCPNRGKAASATAKALEELSHLKEVLVFGKRATFESCVQEASTRFYSLFRDKVLQLTHNFPEVHSLLLLLLLLLLLILFFLCFSPSCGTILRLKTRKCVHMSWWFNLLCFNCLSIEQSG